MRAFLIGVLSGAIACTSDSIHGPPPEDLTVASVSLTSATGTLYAGKALQISATSKNSQGVVLTGKSVAWSSSANQVATVSSDGIVSAGPFSRDGYAASR